MGEFLKWIGRFLGGPISLIGDNLKFLSNSVFGTDFSNRYNDIYNIFNGSYVPEDSNYGTSAEIQNSGVLSDVQNLLRSLAGRYAGTELTGAEREQNAWTAMREDTRYQNAVADMQSAGLNPALMYGGASTPSVNSSAGGISGSGSLSDLLAFAMLPLQMKAMQADINKTVADTRNTEARTRTEEQNALVQSIMVEWLPDLNAGKLAKLWSEVDKAYSDISINESEKDFIDSQTAVQEVMAEYLPSKYEAELTKISAEASNLNASAALSIVRKDFERIQYNFANEHGFLMSSSDTLLIVTYMCYLLGLDESQISNFIQNEVPRVIQDVNERSHFGTAGGPHK